MGMTVFSGMLIATIFGVLLVPVLFVLVEKTRERPQEESDDRTRCSGGDRRTLACASRDIPSRRSPRWSRRGGLHGGAQLPAPRSADAGGIPRRGLDGDHGFRQEHRRHRLVRVFQGHDAAFARAGRARGELRPAHRDGARGRGAGAVRHRAVGALAAGGSRGGRIGEPDQQGPGGRRESLRFRVRREPRPVVGGRSLGTRALAERERRGAVLRHGGGPHGRRDRPRGDGEPGLLQSA